MIRTIEVWLGNEMKVCEARILETGCAIVDPVNCVFPTGKKVHSVRGTAWMRDGRWVVNGRAVLNNKSIRVIGWSKPGDGSGWASDAPRN
jgi:hypothetical protein